MRWRRSSGRRDACSDSQYHEWINGSSDAGYLASLYVDPAASGCGIGSALLAEVLQTFRNRGLTTGSLWVFSANHRARSLSGALGLHGHRPDDHRPAVGCGTDPLPAGPAMRSAATMRSEHRGDFQVDAVGILKGQDGNPRVGQVDDLAVLEVGVGQTLSALLVPASCRKAPTQGMEETTPFMVLAQMVIWLIWSLCGPSGYTLRTLDDGVDVADVRATERGPLLNAARGQHRHHFDPRSSLSTPAIVTAQHTGGAADHGRPAGRPVRA